MSFLQYFHNNVKKIKLVDKHASPLMKTIDVLIKVGNKLKITDIKDDPDTPNDESFMGGYGTTIGRTIYDSPGWHWDDPPSPHMMHELTHVVQFGPRMAMRYVFSPYWRMYYESECAQAELLLNPNSSRSALWFERKVEQFKKYGCNEQVVKSTLRARIIEVINKRPQHSPSVVHDAYKEWMKSEQWQQHAKK